MKKLRDMTAEERQIFSQRVQLYGGVILIFVVVALFLRWYNTNLIAGDGILPTPRKAVEPLAVNYVSQADPRWAGDALGETGYTMEQEGSLFACLSMVLQCNAQIEVTPGELNRRFMEEGLYVEGKAVNVAALDVLYPQAAFSAPKDFDGEDITAELKKGRACMVRVMRGESVHWLCVVGSDQDAFLVLDPALDDALRPLTDYEKVYALGIVK